MLYGRENHVLRELGQKVHCRQEASNVLSETPQTSGGLVVVPVDLAFVPSDGPQHEGWLIQGTLMEGNVLFNDALNTFYLRLYGVIHMVKDHSDSERGNPLPPHGLLLPIGSKGLLYAPLHRHDSTYHGLYYSSCAALAGTRNRSMGPP